MNIELHYQGIGEGAMVEPLMVEGHCLISAKIGHHLSKPNLSTTISLMPTYTGTKSHKNYTH